MSKEGAEYKNPIKYYTNGSTWSEAQKAKIEAIFSNQTPGTFVQDAGQDIGGGTIGQSVWYCTKYTTTPGNLRVWVQTFLDGTKPKATTKYAVLIKGGVAQSIRITAAGVKETTPGAAYTGRWGYNDLNRQGWANKCPSYAFISLSASEIETLKLTAGLTGNTTISLPAEAAATVAAGHEANAAATGGKSTAGTESSPTVTNTPPATNTPNNPSNAPAVPVTPKAKTNKSPGKTKTNKSAKKNPSNTNPNNGLSTVTIKKLPEKIYYNSKAVNFTNSNPYIEQRYTIPGAINSEGEAEIKQIVRRHIFDIVPNTFEFSNLSSVWEEVPRSGNFNMLDWSKYNLTKVGFKFLITGTRTDTFNFTQETNADGSLKPVPPPISTVVNDGMSVSIDDQIANIRQIGAAPYPVRLYNLNTLLTDEYRFPYESPGKGILWVIGDMNITASRVTPKAKNIAVAEVNISLIEYPEIGRDIIYLPPLVPTQPTPKCKGAKCKTTTTQPLGLQTSTYGYVSKNSLDAPSPTQPDA